MSEQNHRKRRCLVIDDRPLVRLGLRNLLGDRYRVEEADSSAQATQGMDQLGDPDVAILPVFRARGASEGLAMLREIAALRPGLPIVALAERSDPRSARKAHEAGALGFVAKSSQTSEIAAAVDAAADGAAHTDPASRSSRTGRPRITARQREILQLLADGHSTRTAATSLRLSPETVKTHTKHILARLEARDRTHAVAIAMRQSLID